jgi:hypothetical protein
MQFPFIFLWKKLFETRHECSAALRQLFASRAFSSFHSKKPEGVKIRVIGDPEDEITQTLFSFIEQIMHNADDAIVDPFPQKDQPASKFAVAWPLV